MNKIKDCFIDSYKSLKSTKTLVMLSLLLALEVVLSFFRITITESLWISPAFIADALMGMICGPVGAAIGGGVGDFLKYIVKPQGAYFPGFTISGIINGLIYGFLLYKNKPTVKNVVISKTLINVITNIGLNTVWIHLLYATPYKALFPVRAVKNLVLLPIEIIILLLVLKSAYEALRRLRKSN